jgi:uncharacterized protein YgbK (DUF1537 family)
MGKEEYYRVLGEAVDDGEFANEIKNARDNATVKRIVRTKTEIELNDEDVADVKAAVDVLPEISRPRPGRKLRY